MFLIIATSADGRLRGAAAARLVGSLVLAVLAFQLNATMLTPALPALGRALGAGPEALSRVSSVFFLSGGILGVVLARWGDLAGRRRVLKLTLLLFCAGSLLCALAPTMTLLLIGRALQGVSAASFPLTYVLLDTLLERRLFGVSLGVVTATSGGVGGIDGYLGGFLAEHLGVRSIFVVVLLAGLAASLSVRLAVPPDRPRAGGARMDWPGAAALSAGLLLLSLGIDHGAVAGWLQPGTLAQGAGALAAFLLLIRLERRADAPLIPMAMLGGPHPGWIVILVTVLVLAGLFPVLNFTLVLLGEDAATGFGLSAPSAALLLLTPASLLGLFVAPFAGQLATRVGWLFVLRVGFALSIAAVLALCVLPRGLGLAVACAAILGIGYNGLLLTACNGLGVLLSPPDTPAALPGLNGAAFGIGASLGFAFVAPALGRGEAAGYTNAFAASAVLAILGLLVSFRLHPASAGSPAATASARSAS